MASSEISKSLAVLHEALQETCKFVEPFPAEPLISQFYKQSQGHLDWFMEHVNFYRDHFIEHPKSLSMFPLAMKTTAKGYQIVGRTGQALRETDNELFEQVKDRLNHRFPELKEMDSMDIYEWMCAHLHELPRELEGKAKLTALRLGLDSSYDLANLSRNLADMFVSFLNLFTAWSAQKKPLRSR